jgi:hypothetical protein
MFDSLLNCGIYCTLLAAAINSLNNFYCKIEKKRLNGMESL